MTDGELNSRVHGDRYGSGQWGAVKRWLVGGSDGHSISSLADWAVGGHHGSGAPGLELPLQDYKNGVA